MIVDIRGGMLDGALPGTPPEASEKIAQAEFVRNLSEMEEVAWTAVWSACDDPDWWEADLRLEK